MHGNVWEWVYDWYAEDYDTSSPQVDPIGPCAGSNRVLRGGSWIDRGTHLRSAIRCFYGPTDCLYYYGFRVLFEL
jgi:formylglycine-generating enzyme required for sulfatase activity